MEPIIIGRWDKIDLPGLGFTKLGAKTDTGAFSSAIHCHKTDLEKSHGKDVLLVWFLDPHHPQYYADPMVFEDFERKKIKNSFGHSEERYLVSLEVELFGKKYISEFSLSDRTGLRFPILLGRRLLRQGFLVDVGRSNLNYKKKYPKKKRTL
jgi:hypothetical protein